MVITRGGGRKSELGTFNDLMIAEAMRRSTIPIVTGIGHQKDKVLADMLADEAAITPTDAADKIIEAQKKTSHPCAEWLVGLFAVLSLVSSLVLLMLMFMTGI